MQKQKIRGMVLAAVVCCVSLSGCGAAEKSTASGAAFPSMGARRNTVGARLI